MEAIPNLLFFLLSAAFISLTGVMMPGPVFAVTVAKGYRDKSAGALIALGHGVIEFPLMALMFLGFSWLITSNQTRIAISLIGGLMLIYMGIEMFRAKGGALEAKEGNMKHGSLMAGIVTTCTNPYFFLWWATIGASLMMDAATFEAVGPPLLAVTHWSCDFLWDSLVSVSVFKTRHLWSKRVHEAVFGSCSLVLMGFGVWYFLSALL